MDAQMRAGRQRGVEMVPELGRLAADIPVAVMGSWREYPLLRTGRLLIAADAGDEAIEAVPGERELEPLGLARGRARGGRQRGVDCLALCTWAYRRNPGLNRRCLRRQSGPCRSGLYRCGACGNRPPSAIVLLICFASTSRAISTKSGRRAALSAPISAILRRFV